MAKLGEVSIINPKDKIDDEEMLVSFVPMQNVSEKGEIDTSDIRKAKDVMKGFTSFSEGDVLMAKITPCMENGKGAIAKGLCNNRGFGSTEFYVIRPKSSIVCSEWIYYYTARKSFRLECERNMTGSAGQKRVPKSYLEKCEIPTPPLETQRKIASNLDKVTHTIDLCNAILEKLDLLAKSRFVEMFGEPSMNPMGWESTTIGKSCYYIKDGPHKSLPDVGEGNGYPFISVRNIVNGYIDFSTARYISEEDYIDSIKKCHPEKGDMLYSKGGTTGIAKLIDVDIKFANWVHVAVLKFDETLNGVFFEHMLNSDYCYEQSQRLTKGIANRDLVLSAMAQIKMYKPPIKLQNQFAAFVEQTDKSKSAVKKLLKKAETLKKALMQEYFG